MTLLEYLNELMELKVKKKMRYSMERVRPREGLKEMFSQIRRSVGRVPRVRERKSGLGPFNVVSKPKVLKMLWWFEKSPRPKMI